VLAEPESRDGSERHATPGAQNTDAQRGLRRLVGAIRTGRAQVLLFSTADRLGWNRALPVVSVNE